MSDSDELDLDGGESPEASTAPSKKGGLGALLPNILKFAAIGLGAVIFIVTVSYITVQATRGDGRTQTVTDLSSPYIGKRPAFNYFTEIGTITTRTRDRHTVTVIMNIGYDQNDQTTASELSVRRLEMRDFVRSYFTGKLSTELQPENEERLKREIVEILNTRFLNDGRVRIILFDRLDLMESDF